MFNSYSDANAALHSGLVRGLGLQHVGGPLNLSALYVVGVPLSTLFTFKFGWGLRGIWGGIAGAFAAQALGLGVLVWGFADFGAIAERVSTEAAYAQLSDGDASGSDYDSEDAGSIPALFDSDAEPERFQMSDVEAGSYTEGTSFNQSKPQFMRRVSSRTRLGGRLGSSRSLVSSSAGGSDSLASSFSRSLTNAAAAGIDGRGPGGVGFHRRISGTYGSRAPMGAPLSASFGSPPRGVGGSGRVRRRRSNASQTSQASDATSNGNQR